MKLNPVELRLLKTGPKGELAFVRGVVEKAQGSPAGPWNSTLLPFIAPDSEHLPSALLKGDGGDAAAADD